MNLLLKMKLSLLLALSFNVCQIQGQSIDELMGIVESQEINFQDLADRLSVLSDHLLESDNELDSKGAELQALAKDLQESLAYAEKSLGDLENEMDSFDAGCQQMMEDRCISQEKRYEKLSSAIESVVELGREPAYLLEMIDNRYDEKFLLKSFEKATEAALEVAEELNELGEDLQEFASACK